MRIFSFAKRNIKELIRDPMSIIFCLCLPLFFLIVFQQFNILTEEYTIDNMTPGMIIFSFSFISLFTGTLVAKDRSSSLLSRLFVGPMHPIEYIFGYTLALIPLTVLQSVLFFGVALLLGLTLSINIFYCILVLIPIAVLFIGLGILIGCITSEKAAGPCGSLVVQLVSFTSGVWFPIDLAGNFFKTLCEILPFSSTIDITRMVLLNSEIDIFKNIIIVFIYTVVVYLLGVIIFKKKMYSDNK